jgi:hypothetical protein
VATTGAPVTGVGGWPGTGDRGTGAGQSLYWFMKVTNKSEARDIDSPMPISPVHKMINF